MRKIMLKEMKLSASLLSYLFILFGFMLFVPGYPILCGAFFVTLGIFQGFQYAREANDIEFSILLPIGKREVVKGKYIFVCFIEVCSLVLMLAVTIIRMTILSESAVYRTNALMNANLFAIGCALIIFGLFNAIFLGGFFKTAYNQGKSFVIYIIVAFTTIGIFEALHHVPGFEIVNSFGFDYIGFQFIMMLAGLVIYLVMTGLSHRTACRNFERIDL